MRSLRTVRARRSLAYWPQSTIHDIRNLSKWFASFSEWLHYSKCDWLRFRRSLYTPRFDNGLKGREYEQRELETGLTRRMESSDGDQDHGTNKRTGSFGFDHVVQAHPRRRRPERQ